MVRVFVRVNVDLDLNRDFSWHYREYPPWWGTGSSSLSPSSPEEVSIHYCTASKVG